MKIVRDIKKLLSYLGMIGGQISKNKTSATYFEINESVPKTKGAKLAPHIKNYKIVRKGEVYASIDGKPLKAKKNFYPILFGQDNYESIFGFAGKKIKK